MTESFDKWNILGELFEYFYGRYNDPIVFAFIN
jgi:hypothetical protein